MERNRHNFQTIDNFSTEGSSISIARSSALEWSRNIKGKGAKPTSMSRMLSDLSYTSTSSSSASSRNLTRSPRPRPRFGPATPVLVEGTGNELIVDLDRLSSGGTMTSRLGSSCLRTSNNTPVSPVPLLNTRRKKLNSASLPDLSLTGSPGETIDLDDSDPFLPKLEAATIKRSSVKNESLSRKSTAQYCSLSALPEANDGQPDGKYHIT